VKERAWPERDRSESRTADQRHYSYSVYADPETARTFDERRFGGPIGEMVAAEQGRVLANLVGRIHDRSILDVGTGTGRAALLFALGGARVTAVDASQEMLAIARKRAAEQVAAVTFLPGDAHRLEFADRSFDVAVSLRVLMHTPRWRTCLAELCRVADRLVIIDYPSRRSMALIDSGIKKFLHAFGVKTEPYRVFSHRQIEDAFRSRGFRIRSVHRQFVLPIAFHKLIGSRRLTSRVERLLDHAGLLKIFGSPVTLVAERCVIS
jgi:ubiquinone/menaquinone biosynthesis C-methylase UbiE